MAARAAGRELRPVGRAQSRARTGRAPPGPVAAHAVARVGASWRQQRSVRRRAVEEDPRAWPSNLSLASYEEDEDFDDDESAPAPYVPLLVRDVMPTAVVTARPDQLVSELDLTQVTGMPVLDAAGAMVGVISKTDIETRAVDAETRVEDLMSRRIKVCRPNNTVAEAAAMMLKYKVHRLPVVKSNAKTGEISLVGIITRTDVYYALETGRL